MAELEMINQFLGERNGQHLRAEIYAAGNIGYTINYYINGTFIKEELIKGHSVHYVEDACNNWLDGIKTLNG